MTHHQHNYLVKRCRESCGCRQLETSDDLSVADDAFIIDNLDVNGSAFIGYLQRRKNNFDTWPIRRLSDPKQQQCNFWDIWNKPDGDLGLYLNTSLRAVQLFLRHHQCFLTAV
ncbi:MAG: hypothetical protein R2788_05405 [Saprospiraceae bacterium]